MLLIVYSFGLGTANCEFPLIIKDFLLLSEEVTWLVLSLFTTFAILKNYFLSSLIIAWSLPIYLSLCISSLFVLLRSFLNETMRSFFYSIMASKCIILALLLFSYCCLSSLRVAMICYSLSLRSRQSDY